MLQAADLNCILSLTYTVEVVVVNISIVSKSINSAECLKGLCFIKIPLRMNANNDYAVVNVFFNVNGMTREKTLVSSMSLSK